MQDKKTSHWILAILRSLGWPIVWGLSAYVCLFVLIQRSVITNEFVIRYLATHPVSYIATGMFFIGMAALIMKAIEVAGQIAVQGRVSLGEFPVGGQSVEDTSEMIERLDDLPVSVQKSYLWKRLRDVLTIVRRKGSADGIDDELKYLSDMDASRQHESYALVRILIWATPMLGFLGTVLGISEALGGLSLGPSNDFESMMKGMRASLYIAFDTTAQALTLSIVMMFVQFLVDKFETQLLDSVDERVTSEIVGRFQQLGQGNDPHLKSIERMNIAMLTAVESLVQRQGQLWQESMSQAQEAWHRSSNEANEHFQENIQAAMSQSLVAFADRLNDAADQSEKRLAHRWENWQVTLSENSRLMNDQLKELTQQSEVIAKVLNATGDVIKLEDALNQNLSALSGAKNFEETVMSLAAAIHLLNSRLDHTTHKKVDLDSSESTERAA